MLSQKHFKNFIKENFKLSYNYIIFKIKNYLQKFKI